MATLNTVLLIGRLTRDPELRYTPQGTAVLDMTMALNRQMTAKDGTKRDETCFIDVVVWAKQAELCAQYLKKGRLVFVEGRLAQDKWESAEGQKRSKIKVTAQRVQFLDRPARPTEQEPQQEAAQELPDNAEFDEEIPL